MSNELDFSIPEADSKHRKGPAGWIYIFFILLLLLSAFNTVILFRNKIAPGKEINGIAPKSGELRQLALKLEKQDLSSQAVEAWKQYLSVYAGDAAETAKIWYRIGKIYQKEGDYDNALDAFYRSESFSRPPDIKEEINRSIQECLESAGKFTALHYELESRVGGGLQEGSENISQSGSGVVAEIGSSRITREELDKKIEKLIESRIEGLSRYLSEDRVKKEEKKLLKQYSSENGRRMFLEQFIIEEILYRKAREDRIAETPEVMDALREMERRFLASKVMEDVYKKEIKITPLDVKNYYEANRNKYIRKDEEGEERQMELEEVRERVMLDLMADKEEDVRNNLISKLMEKYNVVIHNSSLSPAAGTGDK